MKGRDGRNRGRGKKGVGEGGWDSCGSVKHDSFALSRWFGMHRRGKRKILRSAQWGVDVKGGMKKV